MRQARVVIIGGGIMGCALAYHLCREGWRDIILLEKAELTSGSTWHAAGQVTHAVGNATLLAMHVYATDLYARLYEETGQSCTWHGCGSLRMIYDDDELAWARYVLSVGRNFAVPMEIIGPDEIRRLHPFYNLAGVRAALHTPQDGHADPAGAAFALAKGAQQQGATIIRNTRVVGLRQNRSGEWLVATPTEEIRCEQVVNAGGVYAPQIAAWAGVDLPMANMLHHYFVTEPVPEFATLTSELPVVRDDSRVSGYIRMEQKSGLIGIYEKSNAATIWDHGAPWEAEHELFEPDYERVMPWLEEAMVRMPPLAKLGIRRAVCGAITHPPDGNMYLGPAAGVDNFWLCCGAQVGIAWGPGAGQAVAQWMTRGAADLSMRAFDPRRCHQDLRQKAVYLAKGREDYMLRHNTPFPHLDRPVCRPFKVSPLYETLRAHGAVYEEVFGWERPLWYAPPSVPPEPIYGFGRTKLFDIIGAEVQALHTTAAIAELSALAKVELRGDDAANLLRRVSANRLPRRDGALGLTHFILPNGRIEGEAAVWRMADNHYYLTFAAAREMALLDYLQKQKRADEDINLRNVSEDYGVILVSGPRARDILSTLLPPAQLSNDVFPWLTGQEHTVAGVAGVRWLRVSYGGELGWELHIPMAGMQVIYDLLWTSGQDCGARHMGALALNAARMEKGYVGGHELTNEVTMAEADLWRFVGDEDFQGRAATIAPAQRWKLFYLEITATDADVLGGEAVWQNGKRIGIITSGGYGYRTQKSLAFAYLPPTVDAQPLEVFVLGKKRPAQILSAAVFDAANARPRG